MTVHVPQLRERLAAAALAWHRARVEAARLRKERNPIECERQVVTVTDDTASDAQTVPCWKLWKTDRTGEGFDREDVPMWCASCQRRQALTDHLRSANLGRGARQREVVRLAKLADAAAQMEAV